MLKAIIEDIADRLGIKSSTDVLIIATLSVLAYMVISGIWG